MLRSTKTVLLFNTIVLFTSGVVFMSCGTEEHGEVQLVFPLRLYDDKTFINSCKENLKRIPQDIKEKFEIIINGRLETNFRFSDNSSPMFYYVTNGHQRTYQTRRTTVLIAPANIKSSVLSIPANAFLEFHYGYVPPLDPLRNPIFLEIRFLDLNENVIYEYKNKIFGLYKNQWYTERVDLADLGEQEAVLEFSLSSDSAEDSCILLGEPVIRAYEESPAGRPPNIILVSLDTLRGDHVGCIGYGRDTTPTLDRIAEEGVLFTRAFAQSAFTLPSHKSILSGFYPQLFDYFSNALDKNHKKLTDEIPLVQSYLKKAGYYTVAFTGGVALRSAYGFYRDFDMYSQIRDQMKDVENKNRIVKDSGFEDPLGWLEDNYNTGHFFMFLHTYGVHSPYAPPPSYDRYFNTETGSKLAPSVGFRQLEEYNRGLRELREGDVEHIVNVYDRGIRWIDDEVSRLYDLLSHLDILDNTILIILSDHGEQFMEHGKFDHKRMWEHDLHVPLIFRCPKIFPAGKVIDINVELVDVVPTIFEILGLYSINELHGRDLMPLIRRDNGGAGYPERPVFASQHFFVTAKYGGFKYHFVYDKEGGSYERLYDLRSDPQEQKNLLKSDRNRPEAYEDLKYRAIYYIAQNHPGFNVLIRPESESTKYSVNVKGVTFRDNIKELGRQWFTKSGCAGVFVNEPVVEYQGDVCLLTFHGRFEGGFEIGISKWVEGSEPVHLSKILLGLDNGRTVSSPMRIVKGRNFNGCPSISAGLNPDIYLNNEAIVWQNIYEIVDIGDIPVSELSEETLQELRSLGYLQ